MKKQITIEGMSCGHCVKHVEEALKGVSGVSRVEVNLAGKNAIVEGSDSVTDLSLKGAIEEAGYEATEIHPL